MYKFYILEGMTQEDLNKLALERNILAKENQQLRHNRDKALKKLNKYRNRKDHYGLWCMEYIDNADIIHTLKGDNDYEQR